ncbi:unnamed protein product [Tuber melanosporum]|uniref:Sulfhydryl oxidase n=1 Tax=Tuber melanosporum (strain Mel28) TaxID=656061 RepID=D5GN06_TUBMM|nr:uncharacterized protein GSTUM_00011001001 [Tuber melanosporum]CAZ85881.1 unnamed protein product [Tuber melanosporum]
MTRNKPFLLATFFTLFLFFSYILLPSTKPTPPPPPPHLPTTALAQPPPIPSSILAGSAIMPHLGNETLKAELGRAGWKLFHMTLARFPESPSLDERTALAQYLALFARLYPCGECAEHFQKLLAQYPPQTSGRVAASQWGCFVHNLVNERLGKEVFDCMTVGEAYKCGCAEEDEKKGKGEEVVKGRKGKGVVKTTGSSLEENLEGSGRKIEVIKEG